MKGKICSFGEVLLRYSPVAQGDWIRQASMPVFVGGAELNVATALAGWELPAAYCSVLPPNSLADDIVDYIDSKEIDSSRISRSGKRIGCYYLPQGNDIKQGGVIYDREYSAFSELTPSSADWDSMLEGTVWLHLSAISPALNEGVAQTCIELARVATKKGITVSIDLNHRSQLWKYGKSPLDVMPELVQYCDVVMGNIWSANALLGTPLDADIHARGQVSDYLDHAKSTATNIQSLFPRCKVMANTFRFDVPPGGLRYFASLDTAGKQYVSPELRTSSVVDRIGSGDCFMAGLIYGLYQQHIPQDVINFAATAAFGKLQEKGDATQQTVADVKSHIPTSFILP